MTSAAHRAVHPFVALGGALIGAVLLAVGLAAPASAATAPVVPVRQVDLARYVGDWHQVAAIPALYELQCAKDSAADYTANADGTVAVRNTCRTWIGTTSTVTGTARVDNAPANSSLTVSFVSFQGKPIYFGGPNYVIFGLASDYSWALVGHPGHQSGFVLSRAAALTAGQTSTVRSILRANGYDPCSLRYTPQTGGSSSRGAFC